MCVGAHKRHTENKKLQEKEQDKQKRLQICRRSYLLHKKLNCRKQIQNKKYQD